MQKELRRKIREGEREATEGRCRTNYSRVTLVESGKNLNPFWDGGNQTSSDQKEKEV